jgi:hypothetical protein
MLLDDPGVFYDDSKNNRGQMRNLRRRNSVCGGERT